MNSRIRLEAERDQALQELAWLREEIRIKDARMVAISPHRRPHYTPAEGLAIAELKAARAWCLEQTARVFHVTAPTIASWVGRLDGKGPDALVQMRTPVNRYRGVDMVGRPGDPIIFEIDCLNGCRHLPIIRAQRAA